MSSPRAALGVPLVLAASLFFGICGPFGKVVIQAGLSPIQVTWLRICGVGLIALAAAVVPLLRLRGNDQRLPWGALALFGLTAIAAVQAFYFIAVERLPVGIALLLEFMGPIVVVAWVRFVRRTILPRAAVIGTFLSIAGLCIVVEVWSGLRLDAVGLVAGSAAAACQATYFLSGERLTARVDVRVLLAVGFAVGAVALAPFAAPWALDWAALSARVSLGGVEITGLMSVILLITSTALAYGLGLSGLRFLSAPVAGGIGYAEVVVASLSAWALLGEALTVPQILGGLVVIAGVFTAQRAVAAKAGTPDETAEAAVTKVLCLGEPAVDQEARDGDPHGARRRVLGVDPHLPHLLAREPAGVGDLLVLEDQLLGRVRGGAEREHERPRVRPGLARHVFEPVDLDADLLGDLAVHGRLGGLARFDEPGDARVPALPRRRLRRRGLVESCGRGRRGALRRAAVAAVLGQEHPVGAVVDEDDHGRVGAREDRAARVGRELPARLARPQRLAGGRMEAVGRVPMPDRDGLHGDREVAAVPVRFDPEARQAVGQVGEDREHGRVLAAEVDALALGRGVRVVVVQAVLVGGDPLVLGIEDHDLRLFPSGREPFVVAAALAEAVERVDRQGRARHRASISPNAASGSRISPPSPRTTVTARSGSSRSAATR
jgi:drug/metabolite transporter (DMT)-like permease